MKIVITGTDGQLGRSFAKIRDLHPEVEMIFFNRSQLDITSRQAVLDMAEESCPDYIVNCAAYTAVDLAESESDKAYLINVTAVKYLAEAALEVGATLVHYSSDYVYHNGLSTPLKETEPTTPKGIYAQSKLDGETQIKEIGCKSIIIRTSWVYSEYGHNFVKTMLRLGREKDNLTIVDDQIGCPTYATDIAIDTMKMIAGYPYIPDHQVTVNYTGKGQISWYEFAQEIFRLSDISTKLNPIPSSDYPTPAPRPLWSVLDMERVTELFDIVPRDWKSALREMMGK